MSEIYDDWPVEEDLLPGERVPDDLPYESNDPDDIELIHWLLSHTPAERLAIAENWAQGILALRDAKRRNDYPLQGRGESREGPGDAAVAATGPANRAPAR